jgi:uncharacterized membrane protein
VETWIGSLFSLFCHQFPERSPSFGEAAFPLCWRCSGFYFGILSSYFVLALSGGARRRLPGIASLIAASALMTPFLVDGWANTLGLWDTPGWLRASTGLGYGVVLPMVLVPLLDRQTLFDPDLKPTVLHPAALALPLTIGSAMLIALIEPPSDAVFEGLAIAVFLAFLLFIANFLLALRVGKVAPALVPSR